MSGNGAPDSLDFSALHSYNKSISNISSFVFVTKKDKKLSNEAQAFFDYAMKASETITSAGVVP